MSKLKLIHSGGNAVSLNPPTSAPATADVALKLPTSIGTAGQFLTVDGSGNLVWADPPGITHYDCWRLTTNTTDEDRDPLGAVESLERAIDANGDRSGFGTLGDPMTESSGIFTFPVTGIWKVEFQASVQCAQANADIDTKIGVTIDGGTTWEPLTRAEGSNGNDDPHTVPQNNYCSVVIDVTNVSNVKVKMIVANEDADAVILGDGDYNRTCIMFTRLGAT
tara:strand:- start:925 stop:1590 length:666 start_codon:yes stop_codon:yes gene_type:complete